MVQTIVKYFVANTYKPLLVKYLSKNRQYTSNGITLDIPPQVFHPGFFHSTKLLLRAVCDLPLKNKTLLELGAGSGLIAMNAEKQGATATASDINPVAIEYLKKNRLRNGASIRIIHSDLFDAIPPQTFDVIAINPPYYKKDPRHPQEYAWYCGEKGEYFQRLFSSLGNYMHSETEVLMVLCDGCDISMISNMAAGKGFHMSCLHETKSMIETNFIFKINLPKHNAFEEQYIALRKKEQRLYSDEEVRQLPFISADHPHYKEWVARKRSADKLMEHLEKMQSPHILEVGCGNGWLSNKISTTKGSQVTGFDINQIELLQARKVFGGRTNLEFTARDPLAGNGQFDVIVFAASIQYFPSLHEIISRAMARLKAGGSIHITDTHFYRQDEVHAAKKRTEKYFTSIGFAGMSENYFHHSLEELKRFDHEVLYDPGAFWNKLRQKKDPFHWVCIKKSK